MSKCPVVRSFIESKTTEVQTSNVGFTSEVSDYRVMHTGPGLENKQKQKRKQQQIYNVYRGLRTRRVYLKHMLYSRHTPFWSGTLDMFAVVTQFSPKRVVDIGTLLIHQTAEVGCLVGCLTSQQQASVSQGLICSDNFTCCHTQIEVADPTFYLTQSQYTDTGPTSPSADPITLGAWAG